MYAKEVVKQVAVQGRPSEIPFSLDTGGLPDGVGHIVHAEIRRYLCVEQSRWRGVRSVSKPMLGILSSRESRTRPRRSY